MRKLILKVPVLLLEVQSCEGEEILSSQIILVFHDSSFSAHWSHMGGHKEDVKIFQFRPCQEEFVDSIFHYSWGISISGKVRADAESRLSLGLAMLVALLALSFKKNY